MNRSLLFFSFFFTGEPPNGRAVGRARARLGPEPVFNHPRRPHREFLHRMAVGWHAVPAAAPPVPRHAPILLPSSAPQSGGACADV